MLEALKEKIQYFKQVASNYRGDDVETDFTKGQKNALDLVISHIQPIAERGKITQEQLTESFNTWWEEEGEDLVDQGDNQSACNLEEIKNTMLIAWLNGAHIERTHNT